MFHLYPEVEDILSLKRSYKFLCHYVCEPNWLLYLSRIKEAGWLACEIVPRQISPFMRLAILHRWESAQEDHHNDKDERNNPRIFSGDDHSTTQCVVIETEDSDPDSCVLDPLPRFMWVWIPRSAAIAATMGGRMFGTLCFK